jgi:hypothetical protein
MTQEYTPADVDIRRNYVRGYCDRHEEHFPIETRNEARVMFDRWLAAHDAQIRAEALTLSKSDRMVAYDVFDDKVVLPTDVDPEDAEPSNIDTIIRRIFATVANHRKGQKQ